MQVKLHIFRRPFILSRMAKKKRAEASSQSSPHHNGPPQWRNRITGLVILDDADEILAHQNNWRTHDDIQREALRGLLGEVGIVNAAIGFTSADADGKMKLIDGHLRREEIRQGLPVLMTDLNDDEAALVLATLDPLAAMAGTDAANLNALLHQLTPGQASVQAMLSSLAERNHLIPASEVDLDGFFQQGPPTDGIAKEKLILQFPAAQMPAVKNALGMHGPTHEQALLNLLNL